MAERPVSIKELKPGSFVIADGEPCKVVDIAKSKPGKHGAAKVRIEAMGLFDGKKHYILKPADADVMVPIIDKKRAQVISVSGDIAQLMDLTDYSTFEVSVPEELKGKLASGEEVGYWVVMGKKMIIGKT